MTSRKQTLVQLTADLVEGLDRRAASLGVSRSRLIRELLERGLADAAEEDLSRQMLAGYERVPQSEGRDAWGDLDAWAEEASRRNLAALSEEETKPW